MKCEYVHPTLKCTAPAVWEHEGLYLCGWHYCLTLHGIEKATRLAKIDKRFQRKDKR